MPGSSTHVNPLLRTVDHPELGSVAIDVQKVLCPLDPGFRHLKFARPRSCQIFPRFAQLLMPRLESPRSVDVGRVILVVLLGTSGGN